MQNKQQEIDIIEEMQTNIGFPKVISRFKENDYECVAMTLFGMNLKILKSINQGCLGLNTVLNIFYQCLERLECLHNNGYIHCDIKPENIMLGRKKNYKTIYLIDFSLSEKYVDKDGEILEEPAHSVFKGSISF